MGQFIQSILQPNSAIGADGDEVIDLPVNPLSAIFLHINPLNETSTIANYGALQALLSALDRVRVTFRGASVIDLVGQDLAAYLWMAKAWAIRESGLIKTDNFQRSVVLCIPLGRRLWDVNECFPETKRGELELILTWDIADTGYDGLRRSVQTVELLGATPQFFQRITTLTITFPATGENDVELPVGNDIRGILGFGTTAFTGAAPAPTLGALRVLLDNQEYGYVSGDFEVLRAMTCARNAQNPDVNDHFVRGNFVTATEGDSGSQQITNQIYSNYVYLDYDPTDDDQFVIPTRGHARCHIRTNVETANLARFAVVEKVRASEFLQLGGRIPQG